MHCTELPPSVSVWSRWFIGRCIRWQRPLPAAVGELIVRCLVSWSVCFGSAHGNSQVIGRKNDLGLSEHFCWRDFDCGGID